MGLLSVLLILYKRAWRWTRELINGRVMSDFRGILKMRFWISFFKGNSENDNWHSLKDSSPQFGVEFILSIDTFTLCLKKSYFLDSICLLLSWFSPSRIQSIIFLYHLNAPSGRKKDKM